MTRDNKRKDAATVTSTETGAAGDDDVADKDVVAVGAADQDAAGAEDGATPPIIEMRGLEKAYGERLVLKGIDMEIRPGTVTCVLGDNGAGKSTLIKALSGLHQPTGGDADRRGASATAQPKDALDRGLPPCTRTSRWWGRCPCGGTSSWARGSLARWTVEG